MSVSSISFKAYVPVSYFAKFPGKEEYCPVITRENIRKCQGFVVRNLNGTAKNNISSEFVSLYKSYDKDYEKNPVVHSVYDNNKPIVYMVTGSDVDVIKEYAKPVGKAKKKSISVIGNTKSFDAQNASHEFFYKVKRFLSKNCERIHNDNNEPLSLQLFFNSKYNRNNKLTGFEYVEARFVKDGK